MIFKDFCFPLELGSAISAVKCEEEVRAKLKKCETFLKTAQNRLTKAEKNQAAAWDRVHMAAVAVNVAKNEFFAITGEEYGDYIPAVMTAARKAAAEYEESSDYIKRIDLMEQKCERLNWAHEKTLNNLFSAQEEVSAIKAEISEEEARIMELKATIKRLTKETWEAAKPLAQLGWVEGESVTKSGLSDTLKFNVIRYVSRLGLVPDKGKKVRKKDYNDLERLTEYFGRRYPRIKFSGAQFERTEIDIRTTVYELVLGTKWLLENNGWKYVPGCPVRRDEKGHVVDPGSAPTMRWIY